MNEAQYKRAVEYLRLWTIRHPGWPRWSAEDIATALASDANWTTIKLGIWLQTPDGALVARIVEAALPYSMNLPASVLVNGIELAAHQQTQRQRLATLAVTVVGATLIWLLASS